MDKRFAAVDNVEVRKVDLLDLVDEGQRFDSVVMLNVLEHIEDDVAVLRMLGSLLEPDGRAVLYVPALNGLYGKWDRKVGYYRRYAPWRLRAVLDEAGMAPVEMGCMNALSVRSLPPTPRLDPRCAGPRRLRIVVAEYDELCAPHLIQPPAA